MLSIELIVELFIFIKIRLGDIEYIFNMLNYLSY